MRKRIRWAKPPARHPARPAELPFMKAARHRIRLWTFPQAVLRTISLSRKDIICQHLHQHLVTKDLDPAVVAAAGEEGGRPRRWGTCPGARPPPFFASIASLRSTTRTATLLRNFIT